MPPFTPRPRHLLVVGFGLGLLLTATSGSGCGSKQRGAPDAKQAPTPSGASARGKRPQPLGGFAKGNQDARSREAADARGQAPGDSSAVVEALQRKARQADRELDPSSLRRPADDEATSQAAGEEWLRLGSPAPRSHARGTPSPTTTAPVHAAPGAPGAHDASAGTGANGVAVVDKAANPPPVEGQDSFSVPLGQVRTDLTTTSDDGAGLTKRLAQRVQEYPLDITAHLDYQLHRFAMGEPVPHMPSLSSLPQEDRDALVAMLDGLSNFRNAAQAEPNMLLSRKVQPLLEMADRLRGQAELTLPVVALCGTVKGFGVYEPLPPALKAGQDHHAIMYVEVGNFSSRRNEKSQLWETKLKQEAVLFTEGGLPVWTDKSDIPLDTSRNRRHDFYVFKRIMLPKTLTIGRYFLKVTITDEQANRVAENSLPVQVVAQ